MNKEINERIETIKKGNVPNGYIRTKAGLMPCDWIKSKPLTTNMIFENISDKNHGDEYPVLSATQEKGIVLRSEIEKDINFNKENTNSYKLVCKGDYVISLRSFQGGIEYSNMDGLVSPAYTVIRPIIPISDGYYKEYFKTNDFIDRLNSTIYGIRDGKQIGYKDFAELVLHNPPLEEQEKIAEILSRCDTVIEECKKQMEEYKSLKKTCLNKMFPKKGSNTPEIRFPGFTDAWEQRKLSEIATMHARIGWQNLRTSEFLDSGDYMLITGTDFENGSVNYDTCHYVERERYEQDKHIQIENGSILITKDGTLGKVAYVQGLSMPATLNAGVFNVVIKDKKEVDNRYLFQYLKAPYLMDYVDKKATGGTIKHLNQNILVDFPVVLPQKAEQEKIGLYFEKLDNLITLHQRKVDEYKQIKKALTQLLLTGIVRVNKQKEILP